MVTTQVEPAVRRHGATTDEVEPALRRHDAAAAAGGAALLALLALLGLEAKLRSEPFGAAHTLALLALSALVVASVLAMLAMAATSLQGDAWKSWAENHIKLLEQKSEKQQALHKRLMQAAKRTRVLPGDAQM